MVCHSESVPRSKKKTGGASFAIPCLLLPKLCNARGGLDFRVLYSASPSHVTTLLFLTPPPPPPSFSFLVHLLSSPPQKSTAPKGDARRPLACAPDSATVVSACWCRGRAGDVFAVVGVRRQQLGGRLWRDRAAGRAAAAGGGHRAHRCRTAGAAVGALQPGQERRGLHLPQARMRAPSRRPVFLLLRVRRKRPLFPPPTLRSACDRVPPIWRHVDRWLGLFFMRGGDARSASKCGWDVGEFFLGMVDFDSFLGNGRSDFGASSSVAHILENQRMRILLPFMTACLIQECPHVSSGTMKRYLNKKVDELLFDFPILEKNIIFMMHRICFSLQQ